MELEDPEPEDADDGVNLEPDEDEPVAPKRAKLDGLVEEEEPVPRPDEEEDEDDPDGRLDEDDEEEEDFDRPDELLGCSGGIALCVSEYMDA